MIELREFSQNLFKMEHAKWNLDQFGVQSIRITQISIISDQSQTNNKDEKLEEENRKRLLVLSHQICFFGTPCFYFEECPEYSVFFPKSKEKSVIIVYDYFSNFDGFALPMWTERSDFVVEVTAQSLNKNFLNHFQHSLVLYFYYLYRNQNPLYFTSFLLFPYTDYFSDPFLFRPIPVIRLNKIYIRNITSDFSSAIINPPFPLNIHSYICIEPYCHPFFVENIEEQNMDFEEEEEEYSENEDDQNFIFFDNQENHANFHVISDNPEENRKDLKKQKNSKYYATLINIDQEIIKRRIDKNFHYVLLTNPNLYLARLKPAPEEESSSTQIAQPSAQYQTQISESNQSSMQELQLSSKISSNSSFFNFDTTEFYTFNDQSFKDFFEEKFHKQKPNESTEKNDFYEYETKRKTQQSYKIDFFDSKNDFFEYPETNFNSIISEDVSDKEARKELMKTFSRIHEFPNKEIDLILPATSFISFFQFEISLCRSEPLKYTRYFTKFTDVQISHLNNPTIRVNRNGNAQDVNPKTVFEDWKNCHYLPISGKKMASFVVFIVDYHEKNRVIDFFDALRASFTLLELGVLKPCHKKGEDAFIETTTSDFFEVTNNYFKPSEKTDKSQILSEFQQCPIISFVVSPIFFDQTLKSHSICTYLSIDQIKKMKQSEIDRIAFIVYSRIRMFHPFPFGMIDIAPQIPASLFYGYRYQHPYIISRNPSYTGLTLHIAWDPIKKMASWVDDIGTVSHHFPNQTIQSLCRLMLNITQFLNDITVDITFSIISELPSDELVNQIVSLFGCYLKSFSIFSIIPTPQIQIVVNSKVDDDIIIFDDFELTAPINYIPAIPKCSCYVTSPYCTTYRISHYFNSKGEDEKNCLLEFAKNMSHLSWLSGDPQTNQRLFSFPPHVASLLRKVRVKTKVVTGFEFLP